MVQSGMDLQLNNSLVEEIDSYLIASERRRIALSRRRNPHKPFVVVVYHRRTIDSITTETVLSFSEYHTLDCARAIFEERRPKMRDSAGEEVPMQRGKRLVQEKMAEILGPSSNTSQGVGL